MFLNNLFGIDSEERYLPNKQTFETNLSEEIKKAKNDKIIVLFLKVDRFKQIKESFNTDFSQKLYNEMWKRLKEVVNTSSLMRIGVDEYAYYVTDAIKISMIKNKCDRIQRQFYRPFFIEGLHIKLNVKVGVSTFPNEGIDATQLLQNARFSIYKKGESPYYSYKPFTYHEQRNEFIIESDIYRALIENEFFLMYQPQIQMEKKKVTGVEALIRWKHPKEGISLPAEFIPIAEKSGLIVHIGEWVLKTACKQLKDWHEKGYDHLKMSINLSVRQFYEQDFVRILKTTLDESNIAPTNLELEVTESIAMTQISNTLTILNELKRIGVSIALDDFGTGYSSLNYLNQLPIDRIKIDRSFIRDISEQDTATIVSTIIQMAKKLNIDVVAEGVETVEQLNTLIKNHCYTMQGYLFSEPAHHEELLFKINSMKF